MGRQGGAFRLKARAPPSPKKAPRITHDQALARALLAVTRAGGRAFRHEVGTFQDVRGRWHRIGTVGEPDIMGCTATGRALAVEVKVNRDRLKPAQLAFARAWTRLGGLHIEARYGDGVDGDATIAAALVHSRDKVPSRQRTDLSPANRPRDKVPCPAAGDKPATRR